MGTLQIRRRTVESQHTGPRRGRIVIPAIFCGRVGIAVRRLSLDWSVGSVDDRRRTEARGNGRSHRSRGAQGSGAAQDAQARAGARAVLLRPRCPFTYLAAERVERAFSHVDLDAAVGGDAAAPLPGRRSRGCERMREAAERRAAALRLPLVWPELPAAGARRDARGGLRGRAGPRARLRARRGPARVLRRLRPRRPGDPGRGGGRRGHPARGLLPRRGRRAARRRAEAVGRKLLAAGADRLPVLRVGRSLFWGEQRVGAAAASVRQSTPALARRAEPPTG